MRKNLLIVLATFLGNQMMAQTCVSSDVYDVEDANAYCFEVDGNVRHVYANNYPDHSDNYKQSFFTLTAGDYEYYMCAYPEEATDFTPLYEETETTVGCEYNYEFGVSINGVRYDPNSAETFVNDDDGDGSNDDSNNLNWHVEATSTSNTIGTQMGTDNGGHLNSKGEYHYHAVPYDYFTNDLGIDGSEHSSIVGYAADGFPIYYKYVYTDSEDALSAITSASSGYSLKSGDRPGDGLTAPDGSYDGNYYEDYEYSSANTILDECNGRYGVTPDYPYGTYYYVITDEYPYIPRCFKGTYVDHSFRVGPSASCPSSTASTSCASEVTGCMDPFSDNYNASANVDDGSCSYSTITWSGTWSNTDGPGDGNHVSLSSDYTFSTDGKFSCDNLTVATGVTLTVDSEEALVVNGDLTNNGTIVIESGGSLITYDGTTFSGNDVTIKRNTRYSDGKYSFVGTPVNQTGQILGSDLGSYVYSYDETQGFADNGLNRWIDASSDELVPGKGYTQAFQQEISFTGIPNDGTISVTGTYTDRTNTNVEGWMLVSNPYPAAISVYRFLNENTNLTGAVYFWDDNNSQSARGSNADYIAANGITTTQSSQAGNEDRYNQHIASSQGFIVKFDDNTDLVVDFTESMRVSDSNADGHFFRTTSESVPYVRINLTDHDGLFKQTVVGWVHGVSDDELNRIYDAPAINHDSDDAIYSMKQDQALIIQGVSYDREEILLGINVGTAGSYMLSLSDDNSSVKDVMLYDSYTDQTVDLSQGYSFVAQAGKSTDRFRILLQSGILGTPSSSSTKIYAHQKTIYVEYAEAEIRERTIRIYDLSGHLVSQKTLKESGQITMDQVRSGVYVVTDGSMTQKVFLN